MVSENIAVGIAREICFNFLESRQATRRHDLIIQFEVTNLLSEMEMRGLCKRINNGTEYLPSSGSFAVLPSDDNLHQRAELSFTATVRVLRQLFIAEGSRLQYRVDALLARASDFGEQVDADGLALGLYLSQDFGILFPPLMSEDGIHVVGCGIGEHVINLKDPREDWAARARSAREAIQQSLVPVDIRHAAMLEEFSDELLEDSDVSDFWSLLHPSIIPEARRRFRAGLYAEAVLAALKVISLEVKDRTGLDLDGAALMNKAFSVSQPYLVFDPLQTETARSIQQGYMHIFAGTMMAIRNPKAHGFVEIDVTRCIHFLYLASLLAYKLDEAKRVVTA